MAATECQYRLITELLTHIDGAWLTDPLDACRKAPVFEVHVEHVVGLRAELCGEHQLEASTDARHARSVKLRT